MGPVIAALPVILKVVAVVSSAVTMIKGLKEGNMMMAVMGGLGAAAGMGALGASGAGAAGAAESSSSLGALGGEAASVGDVVVNNAGGAMGAAATAAPQAAPFSLSSISGGGMGDAMGASMAAGAPAAAATAPASGGLLGQLGLGDVASKGTGIVDSAMEGLGKLGEAALENKDVLANVGGGLLKGYAAGKMKEEEMDWLDKNRREGWARDERLDAERRRRAGYTPRRGPGSYRWAGGSTTEGGAE